MDNQNKWRKAYRLSNMDKTRQLSRISWWMHKQKDLADSRLKNRLYKAYEVNLDDSVPTFLLCEQLKIS
ncbi:hypothetical protein J4231_00140 [Candidatus Woesearchaeota archaeon]|nr:hypothetical protein [Candidatus Woesearchaeota archaeon]